MAHTVGVALPSTKQLRDLLESRLRREVRLQPSLPLATGTRGLSFGIYVDSHLSTHAVVVVDLPAAAYIGAAAGLVPLGVATAAVDEHVLGPLLADHFRAVLKDLAQLFDHEGAQGVRLYNAVLPGQRPPADIVSLAAAPGRRLDLGVAVRAYGEGSLSLVMGR
jgi:hypothetical protein